MDSFYQGFLNGLTSLLPAFRLLASHLPAIAAAIALGVALALLGMADLGGWIIVVAALWLLGVSVIGWWRMIAAVRGR